MGSIASTLNSINSSLLSEINNYNASPSQTSAGTSSGTAASDTVDFSQVAQLFKDLKQLETSNPTEFKQVLTDAATQLKAAASQTTNSQQAAFLNNLADKFQAAATTGDLSGLTQPTSSAGTANGLYSAQGHHHHHGGGHGSEGTSTSNAAQTQNSQTTTGGATS